MTGYDSFSSRGFALNGSNKMDALKEFGQKAGEKMNEGAQATKEASCDACNCIKDATKGGKGGGGGGFGGFGGSWTGRKLKEGAVATKGATMDLQDAIRDAQDNRKQSKESSSDKEQREKK
ncbi:hypothetical protein Q1695_005585 [Nippostrongylus brasiliensis]|nr:hypothetical protein Q1695_005585 [Nippostrongylus brasiliensis]